MKKIKNYRQEERERKEERMGVKIKKKIKIKAIHKSNILNIKN